MIARALYTLPDFDKTLVSGILTQATPHVMPVIAIDPVLANFYHQVNEHWANSLGRDVLIVSTGGGYRDILVRTGLTSLSKVTFGVTILLLNDVGFTFGFAYRFAVGFSF